MLTLTTAKVITFNRDTKDFDAYFEDQYIGSFPTMHQAENELNSHVLRLCEDRLIDQPLAALAEQALAAANPEPQPPVDDDIQDNFGGWRCRNCGGAHHIQHCPEIWAALRADPDDGPPPPWDAPDAGRAVGRQWLRDRARFLDVLRGLDRDAWQLLAAAYCAWMNRGGCGIEVEHVILIWRKAVEADIALPPRLGRIIQAADASVESYATYYHHTQK